MEQWTKQGVFVPLLVQGHSARVSVRALDSLGDSHDDAAPVSATRARSEASVSKLPSLAIVKVTSDVANLCGNNDNLI